MVKDVLSNFRSRGLLDNRAILAQSFAELMPGTMMTTEIGKAAESDTCEKAFILRQAIISYPTSTAYDFVNKKYNHIIIKDYKAPKTTANCVQTT